MRKFVTLLICTLSISGGLSACSGTGMSTMNYMDRDDLMQASGETSIDGIKYDDYGRSHTIHSYGALQSKSFDATTGEPDGTTINLKRDKSRLYAETSIFDNDNKDKSTFDKGIFNVGVDKKTKGLGMELSLQF